MHTLTLLCMLGLWRPAAMAEPPSAVPASPSSNVLLEIPVSGDMAAPEVPFDVDPQERARAAMQMLATVVVGFLVVLLLLRWVGARTRASRLGPAPEEDIVERATKALEQMEREKRIPSKGTGDDSGTGRQE